MTKEEFEAAYVSRSGITKEFYHKHLVSLRCYCGEDCCDGWAAIRNSEESIKMHNDFHGQKITK